jgi:hypothetical protein
MRRVHACDFVHKRPLDVRIAVWADQLFHARACVERIPFLHGGDDGDALRS